MANAACDMSVKIAREVLGVSSLSTPAEVRAAWRDAAKRAHPDSGGDEAAFHQVSEAFRRLQQAEVEAEAPETAPDPTLEISPLQSLEGGEASHILSGDRVVRISLPPGLRSGDKVRAAGLTLTIYVRARDGVLVRGDDVWMTARLAPAMLRKGGRLQVDTPLGRRAVWVDAKAAERGLVRLEGQGLPARGRHAKGHLFIRLIAQPAVAEGAALGLLRRFAAAWAV